jgi:Ca2+:H+ antiporter
MMVASVSLIVPTTMSPQLLPANLIAANIKNDMLSLSRITAIILLALFFLYIYFQLKTHTYLFLFLDPADDRSLISAVRRESSIAEEIHRPTLNLWAASGVLITSAFCIVICVSFLIDTADGLAKAKAVNLSKTFIGLVLIPTAGNIGKCAAMVAISMKKIDFAIRTIVNSVLQITLFITPSLVLLGWVLGKPVMLNFDVFEAAVFFLAIIVVSYVIQDGRTNYFEGIMLTGTYVKCFLYLGGL